jgi:hypothetical protein
MLDGLRGRPWSIFFGGLPFSGLPSGVVRYSGARGDKGTKCTRRRPKRDYASTALFRVGYHG